MVCYGDHEEEKLTAVVIRFVLLPKFRSELPNHPFTYLQSYCTLFMNHQSHFELKVHEANAGESGLSQNNMPLKNNQCVILHQSISDCFQHQSSHACSH